MKKQIYECVLRGIEEFNNNFNLKIDTYKGNETELFGGNSIIDSLGLVNLIVVIEEQLSEKFNISIALASEKAMSRKVSPFKTVGSLCNYVEEIISEKMTEKK